MSHPMKSLIVILCVFLAAFDLAAKENIAPESMQEMDSILHELDSPGKPALSIALIKKDRLLYQKTFGSANLEYQIAATDETIYQVDALAWEFVAYATLLLEEQGKIRRHDDIRRYLPALPGFAGKITINHLLSSTDGLHGYKVLQSLAGWKSAPGEQVQDIVRLVSMQKAPNFAPGTAFSPGGDTRLILLAKIVEAVSGQAFDDYAKQQIFAPLGMSRTVFVPDAKQTVRNVALPYRQDASGRYLHEQASGSVAGPLNLYTSIGDLAKWRMALASQAAERQSVASKLDLPIRLDDGTVIKDMSSISTYAQQHAGKERGIAKTYQLGNSGGYASSIFRFPGQDLTVVTLSSGLAYNGSYGMRVASVLLKDDFSEPLTIDYDKISRVKLSKEQLQKFEGNYWSPVRALAAKVYLENDVLYYRRIDGVNSRVLIPLDESTFQMKIDGDDHYFIKFVQGPHGRHMHFMMEQSDPIIFESYQPVSYASDELARFAGTFHNEETDASFVVEAKDGLLFASNLRTGAVQFRPVSQDVFSGNKSFMAGIEFHRGRDREITGFQVVVDEVRNLQFSKVRSLHDQTVSR